jgi:hypothetical protein
VGLSFLFLAVVRIFFGASRGHFSWGWLLGAIVVIFVGPPIVFHALKGAVQIVGLIVTPLLLVASFFVK